MKKKSLTSLEKEKFKKKLLAEAEEKLKAIGQPSDRKAAKWVIETEKEKEKKQKKEEQYKLEILDKKKKWNSYNYYLCQVLHDLIVPIRLPKSYRWGVYFDGKGVRVFIIDPKGFRKDRAFKPSHDPKYDLNACYILASWVEDIYDKLSPVWIPPSSRMSSRIN